MTNKYILSSIVSVLGMIIVLHLDAVFSVCAAQDEGEDQPRYSGAAFDFTDDNFVSTLEDEGIQWNMGIWASHYGESGGSCYGGYGNKLNPMTDYFCALPANRDSLDVLGGALAGRMERCGYTDEDLEEMTLCIAQEEIGTSEPIDFWPGDDSGDDGHGWMIEGDEGDGLFRVIEIRLSGKDGPVIEAYVGDVGPWCQTDPYWETYSRPDAEDGIDSHGRTTNHAGIDLSYALAQALGFSGMARIDWRWKIINGKYVVRRQPTEWRW